MGQGAYHPLLSLCQTIARTCVVWCQNRMQVCLMPVCPDALGSHETQRYMLQQLVCSSALVGLWRLAVSS